MLFFKFLGATLMVGCVTGTNIATGLLERQDAMDEAAKGSLKTGMLNDTKLAEAAKEWCEKYQCPAKIEPTRLGKYLSNKFRRFQLSKTKDKANKIVERYVTNEINWGDKKLEETEMEKAVEELYYADLKKFLQQEEDTCTPMVEWYAGGRHKVKDEIQKVTEEIKQTLRFKRKIRFSVNAFIALRCNAITNLELYEKFKQAAGITENTNTRSQSADGTDDEPKFGRPRSNSVNYSTMAENSQNGTHKEFMEGLPTLQGAIYRLTKGQDKTLAHDEYTNFRFNFAKLYFKLNKRLVDLPSWTEEELANLKESSSWTEEELANVKETQRKELESIEEMTVRMCTIITPVCIAFTLYIQSIEDKNTDLMWCKIVKLFGSIAMIFLQVVKLEANTEALFSSWKTLSEAEGNVNLEEASGGIAGSTNQLDAADAANQLSETVLGVSKHNQFIQKIRDDWRKLSKGDYKTKLDNIQKFRAAMKEVGDFFRDQSYFFKSTEVPEEILAGVLEFKKRFQADSSIGLKWEVDSDVQQKEDIRQIILDLFENTKGIREAKAESHQYGSRLEAFFQSETLTTENSSGASPAVSTVPDTVDSSLSQGESSPTIRRAARLYKRFLGDIPEVDIDDYLKKKGLTSEEISKARDLAQKNMADNMGNMHPDTGRRPRRRLMDRLVDAENQFN